MNTFPTHNYASISPPNTHFNPKLGFNSEKTNQTCRHTCFSPLECFGITMIHGFYVYTWFGEILVYFKFQSVSTKINFHRSWSLSLGTDTGNPVFYFIGTKWHHGVTFLSSWSKQNQNPAINVNENIPKISPKFVKKW